jgi:hypothetical protein
MDFDAVLGIPVNRDEEKKKGTIQAIVDALKQDWNRIVGHGDDDQKKVEGRSSPGERREAGPQVEGGLGGGSPQKTALRKGRHKPTAVAPRFQSPNAWSEPTADFPLPRNIE